MVGRAFVCGMLQSIFWEHISTIASDVYLFAAVVVARTVV
jgi:hypothetical protein